MNKGIATATTVTVLLHILVYLPRYHKVVGTNKYTLINILPRIVCFVFTSANANSNQDDFVDA